MSSNFLVSFFSCSLAVLGLASCSPPDKPYETVHSRRRTVTPLSVAENPGIGYSYYLIGRLLQAKYLFETALHGGEPLVDIARKNKKCRRYRLLDSGSGNREVFYFQYPNCQVQDDRVLIYLSGEERFEVVREPRQSDSSQKMMTHLSYSTQEMTVDLKPRKGVKLALQKKAEIDENLAMVADLASSDFYTDEQGVSHVEDKYSFYFRTTPSNQVFQNLVAGKMSALENSDEGFQIFGFFVVRAGRIVRFEKGELRLRTSGSRRVRSKDRSVKFSQFSQVKIALITLKNKPLGMEGVCATPVGRLKRVAFSIPRVRRPAKENRKAAKAYELQAENFVELRTGQSLGWSSCLAESWGRALPYGQIFLR